ncbi:MAG: tetratricopeptide repeat protein [Desulfovibrionaceae bacterium]
MGDDPKTLLAMGARLHGRGELERAVGLYRGSLELDPGQGECALLLGMALLTLGRAEEAVPVLERAVGLMPEDADPLNALGAARFQAGDLDGSRAAHLLALKHAPESVEALDGLGNVAQARGRPQRAVEFYERAIAIAPSARTLSNLGAALKTAGRAREAVERLLQSLELEPGDPDTLANLGNAWQALGHTENAVDCFDRALGAAPASMAARWGGVFARIPLFFSTEAEIAPARAAYGNALKELDDYLDTDERLAMAAEAVGTHQPFYLAYHGRNDAELQTRYGTLCHRAMAARFPSFAGTPAPRPRRARLRVGVLSGLMHEHSVWKIPARGWAEGLDRSRFEVFGYHVGFKHDQRSEEARGLFDHFLHEPHDFSSLLRAVRRHDLDALLYPEIGMDPTTLRAAALRLAPVQAVSLGHPMTTGLPTMDYFLSSSLMEPEDGERWYTERLIRLPGLSVRYAPLPVPRESFSRSDFGLPDHAFLFLCPQSLFKLLPQHDELFARIARHLPDCRFVFVEHLGADVLSQRFLARMGRAFAAHTLRADDFVILLPYQTRERFHGLNSVCDLFLDSLGWSGFNTAMEAAGAGLPAISCPQPFSGESTPMRARHCAAVLETMGLEENIARDLDDYVELAVRIAHEPAALDRLKRHTRERRQRLYNDDACIRGLEAFLMEACERARS